MSRAVIFFADGFEECEGLIVLDLLRRAGTEVISASVNGTETVISSHKVEIKADELAENIDYCSVDAVILPGGIPGTWNLAANKTVIQQCCVFAENKLLAAICAAPSILAELGLLEGKKATVHPNFEDKMRGAVLTHSHVACDGNIITGQGMGAATEFALELAARLEGRENADKVAKGICW